MDAGLVIDPSLRLLFGGGFLLFCLFVLGGRQVAVKISAFQLFLSEPVFRRKMPLGRKSVFPDIISLTKSFVYVLKLEISKSKSKRFQSTVGEFTALLTVSLPLTDPISPDLRHAAKTGSRELYGSPAPRGVWGLPTTSCHNTGNPAFSVLRGSRGLRKMCHLGTPV